LIHSEVLLLHKLVIAFIFYRIKIVMSNVEAFTDGIEPFNGSTVALYNTDISGTAPSVDQILTAESGTSAVWQTGVNALKTSGAPVIIGNTNVYTNQALKASSPTVASFVDFSTDVKESVRVATTTAGTLASDFENGDTIDGVVLVTGDRILIKDQTTGTENGIYIVETTGTPTRASDFASGESVGSNFMFVQEGVVNRELGFLCTNINGNDTVGTDVLTFQVFSYSGRKILVNTITALEAALAAGASHIQIAPGTYTITQLNITQSNVVLEGIGNVIIQRTIGFQTVLIDGAQNVTLKGITLNGNSGICLRIENGSLNVTIDKCTITNFTFGVFANNDPDGLLIKDCNIENGTSTGLLLGGSNIIVTGCYFTSVGIFTHMTINSNNSIVKECIFEGSAQFGIEAVTSLATSKVIVSDSIFRGMTSASIFVSGSGATIAPAIVTNCHFDTAASLVSNRRILLQGCQFADATGDAVFLNTANSSFSSICNNTFLNPTLFAIEIASNSDNSLIADNAFEPLTTSSNFINFASLASSTFTKITRNNAIYDLNENGGSSNYDGDFDALVMELISDGPDEIINLQDLSIGSAGHYIAIRADVIIGANFIVTPVNTTNTDGTSYTSIQINAASQTAALQWTGRGWKIFNIGTSTLVP